MTNAKQKRRLIFKLVTSIIVLMAFFLVEVNSVFGQAEKGKVVTEHLYAESLENDAGENPERRVTVYLPPGYEDSTQRYPVVYFLHGGNWSDSLMIAVDHFDKLLDKAINEGIMRPIIVVMPDQYTRYRGSFYTNSTFTGKWEDFTARDLIKFIDENYRTLASRGSRGIAGHSMGGYGAIKIGMRYPEVFSVIYGLNPCCLDLPKEFTRDHPAFRRISELKTREEVITGYDEMVPNMIISYAQAISPNPNKPPFYIDLPYEYQGDEVIVNEQVLELWNRESPVYMAASHVDNLKKLTAIKFDWGRKEETLSELSKDLSKELEKYGIKHFAEEYLGDHTNMLWTDDGRAITDLFPFFNRYLKFE